MWRCIQILITVTTICTLVEGQIGIKCYSCSSMSNKKCGEEKFGLASPDAVSCQGTCIKRRGRRDDGGVSIVEITRGCVDQSPDGCTNEHYNGISVRACRCNTDYCNTATNIHVTMAATTLSLMTMLYLYFT